MIEWVPIKDFELKPDCMFLILTENKAKLAKVFMAEYKPLRISDERKVIYVEDALCFYVGAQYEQLSSRYFSGFKVTHAAKLNLPKEKTLAEKFEGWAEENKVLTSPNCLTELALIAKQHYEKGEK